MIYFAEMIQAYYHYLNELVNKCKLEFSAYPEIKWLDLQQAIEKQEIRDALLAGTETTSLFKNTKPYYSQISKGCQLCGLGVWSCLFITGKCNASCFYCPTSQEEEDVPNSQGLYFPTPESYAEYVNYFKFKGVAFSGGEPLLQIERVLLYLKRIRKTCSPEIYTWMYTNGILASESTFKKLAALNLNEVRFDIGATGYSLENIKKAQGIIKNISIEIPAIPEEKERLKALLPEMVKLGVTNLNLHQLRLTHYNVAKLLKRNYTIIPAEKPIVLESELAALEIISYARKNKIKIGINYCSFFFKNRFQQVGIRKQIANTLADPDELITPKGYLRNQSASKIEYETIRLYNDENCQNRGIQLNLKFKNYRYTRSKEMHQVMTDEQMIANTDQLIRVEPEVIPEDSDLFEVWKYEYIEKDLRNY